MEWAEGSFFIKHKEGHSLREGGNGHLCPMSQPLKSCRVHVPGLIGCKSSSPGTFHVRFLLRILNEDFAVKHA